MVTGNSEVTNAPKMMTLSLTFGKNSSSKISKYLYAIYKS